MARWFGIIGKLKFDCWDDDDDNKDCVNAYWEDDKE